MKTIVRENERDSERENRCWSGDDASMQSHWHILIDNNMFSIQNKNNLSHANYKFYK